MKVNGIDEKDNEIIQLLQEDARMSYSDIGKKVKLSRTAVKNRVKNLEDKGIISGYKVVLQPHEAEEMMTFVVNIETKPEVFDNVKDLFAAAEESVTILQTTGKCHLTAICLSKDMKSMRNFVNGMYKAIDGISYINANAVMDVIKGSIFLD